MGRNVREKTVISHRRMQVGELYLKGMTQVAIGLHLGVSQATISGDLKAVRKEWKDKRITDFDSLVAEDVQRLRRIALEAWNGWAKSQQPVETMRVVQKNGEKKAEKTIRQQTGDPRFLKLLLETAQKARELYAVDEEAKLRVQQSDKAETGKKSLSFDDLFAEQRQKDRWKAIEQKIADVGKSAQ